MIASRACLPLFVIALAGCSSARADASATSAGALEATKTFHCSLTKTEKGVSVVEEGTISLNVGTQWLRMSRTFTFGTQVTTGSLQGYAVFSSGNLNPSFASAASYMIGESG